MMLVVSLILLLPIFAWGQDPQTSKERKMARQMEVARQRQCLPELHALSIKSDARHDLEMRLGQVITERNKLRAELRKLKKAAAAAEEELEEKEKEKEKAEVEAEAEAEVTTDGGKE